MGCDQFEQQTRNAFEIDALHPIKNSLYEQIRFPTPSGSGEEATLIDQHRWCYLQKSELPAIPSSRNAERFLQKIEPYISLSSKPKQPARNSARRKPGARPRESAKRSTSTGSKLTFPQSYETKFTHSINLHAPPYLNDLRPKPTRAEYT